MNRLRRYTVAVAQMDSQNDKEANLRTACRYAEEAAANAQSSSAFRKI